MTVEVNGVPVTDRADLPDEVVFYEGLYRDPPNISFGRSIPPENAWPGRRTNPDDVARACGDGRDWFRYFHRIDRHLKYWESYDRWAPKRDVDDYFRGFSWNQRLIIGQYGVGKTTISIDRGKDRIKRGFPYFHNGPSLIGWVIEGDDVFTAMATIPPCSTLTMDEAHASLPGRLGGATAVAVFVTLGANIRKDNCQLDIVSAQWETVHPRIRQDCVEVIRPFRVNATGTDKRAGTETWNDPTKYILAWDVWEGSPMQDPEVRRHGIDTRPYDYWAIDTGNSARDAFLLTDSFQRLDAGTAILADKEGIKDRLSKIRGDLQKESAGDPTRNAILEVVGSISYDDNAVDDVPWITASQVSQLISEDHGIEVDPRKIGTAMGELFGLKQRRNYGYSTSRRWLTPTASTRSADMTTPTIEQNGQKPDGEWYAGLEDLPSFSPEIHREGGNNQNAGDQRDFNRFIFLQAEFQQQNPLGVLSLGRIKDPHELRLMDILQAMFLLDFNAEVTNRKGLRDEADKTANFWKGKFGDETVHEETKDGTPVPSVEDLLEQWHSAAAFMARVAIEESLHGLRAVERYRRSFIAARESRQEAEFNAAILPPARNKYFWATIRSYQLMLEENEDVALGRPIRDYTDVKKKLADSVSVHRLLGDMPWPYQMMHARVFASVADGDTLRDYYATLFTHTWPYDRRPKKEPKGLAKFFDRRDDDDDEEEPSRRRDEEEEKQAQKKGMFGRRNGNGGKGK